jgi:hypothetical protein
MAGNSSAVNSPLSALYLFRDIPSTNQYLLDEKIAQATGPVACFAEHKNQKKQIQKAGAQNK